MSKKLIVSVLVLSIAWFVINVVINVGGTYFLGESLNYFDAIYRVKITTIIVFSLFWLFLLVKNKFYSNLASFVIYMILLGIGLLLTWTQMT